MCYGPAFTATSRGVRDNSWLQAIVSFSDRTIHYVSKTNSLNFLRYTI